MNTIIERINFTNLDINDSSQAYTCKVVFALRHSASDWTEVAVLVHLPKDDYKLSELKEAALQKAKEALSGLSEGGCVVSPPQTEVKRNQSQNP